MNGEPWASLASWQLSVVTVAAETTDSAGFGILLQYGVLGVFATLLVIFARISYRREIDRADRLEKEVVRLNSTIQDKVIPALESATRAIEQSTLLLLDMQREREREAVIRLRAEGLGK